MSQLLHECGARLLVLVLASFGAVIVHAELTAGRWCRSVMD
jgi:hypothetical protein